MCAVLVGASKLFRPPKTVERGSEPEADHGVRDEDAREEEDAEAGKQDDRRIEAYAGAAEETTGEGLKKQREREDGQRKRDAGGGGERAWGSSAEERGELHACGHGPVHQRRFFEVADTVGVERDVVVAEEHFTGHFGVDRVGVVEQRRCEQGEGRVER